MGQQQLLLLVLGIVIVGIAVVAGIQAFSEGKAKAEQDAAVSDAMRIISDVQAWKLKPGAFGGGADKDSTDFSGVSFQALGYPAENGIYSTVNGCYELTADGGNGATLALFKKAGTTEDGSADCDANTQIASVTIKGTGTSANDLQWSYK